jgi:hypothetical protein
VHSISYFSLFQIADLESQILNHQLRLNGTIIRSESHFIALCSVLRRHGASLHVLRLHDIDLCIRRRAERLSAALFQGQTALRLLSFTDCSLGVVRRDGSSALESLLHSMSLISNNSSVVAEMHSLRLERQSLTDRHLSALRAFVERASDNLREISLVGFVVFQDFVLPECVEFNCTLSTGMALLVKSCSTLSRAVPWCATLLVDR